MNTIDDKRLNEMIAGMKLYADMPYGIKINEFSAKDLYSAMVELQELRQIKAARQWVSVADRLPEIGCTVLVIDKHEIIRTVYLSRYQSTDYWIGAWPGKEYSFCMSSFTHWMPLPPLLGTGEGE